MNIKSELLSSQLARIIKENMEAFDIYADAITDSAAISALNEIKSVINEGLSDHDIVDMIIKILKQYNIDTGACHNPFYLLDKAAKQNEKQTAFKKKMKVK